MKNKLIIIASILFATVVVLFIVNKISSNSKSNQAQNINASKTAANLPADPLSAGIGRVEDANNPGQISDSFKTYANQKTDTPNPRVSNGISSVYSLDDAKTKKEVELDKFLQAVGADINPQVKSLVESKYYGMFYCVNENRQKEFGVAFDTGSGTFNNLQKENIEVKEAMRKWEPYMFKDIHSILFPLDDLKEDDLSQPVIFRDGEFRFADVTVSGGRISLNYAVKADEGSSVNRIYITASPECLRKSLNYLFDF